ncbi:hypothetical protein BgAZ_200710 [Babesia gibsoni]|uniref:Uncharacterized protein n=1 Tax=Babesia gibsoni TaxID=33632 RepID=A0AAD8LI81_BABGI|nr:hypothetical protein BgAZ_200710 [Babesia gibsoni]
MVDSTGDVVDVPVDITLRLPDDGSSDKESGSSAHTSLNNMSSSPKRDSATAAESAMRRQNSFSSVSRNFEEQNINLRIKQADERKQWSSIKSLMKKINSYSESCGDVGWGPSYEIPGKPARKGPTLGLHFSQAKRTENCSIIMQTPDAMERYSFYGKLMQHTSCSPYAITKVTYGHVVGIGVCVLCGTQCGKVLVHTLERFERVLTLDTLQLYGKSVPVENGSSASNLDDSSNGATNAFEINALELVKTFDTFARQMIVGNQLGHLLIVDLPSMKLLNVIYYPVKGANECTSGDHENNGELSDDEYGDIPEMQTMKTPINMGEPSTYISCMGVNGGLNDLWVGYGDGTFAVFEIPSGRCKMHVAANDVENEAGCNIDVDARWQCVVGIHFSLMLELALVVYGNIRVDVWDTRCHSLLKSFPASIFTCGTSLVSSMCIYENFEKMCLLFVGSMDGSLILRKVERLPNNDISWSLLFNLLYDVKFNGTSVEKTQEENEIDSGDFRGAPITCICPLISHNAVIVGNACGGLVSAWNILRRIRNK